MSSEVAKVELQTASTEVVNSPLKPAVEISQEDKDRLDDAEIFLREHNYTWAYIGELAQDKKTAKKVLSRVDWHLMPLLCGTYFLQFIDKAALSSGAIFDLFPDTGISLDQYSWLASIFYFAYLVAEWPCSYLAQHYSPGIVVSSFVFTWGSILMMTVASTNFTGLAICRFLLGTFEAVITPCFMMIVATWYPREKQSARAGLFYCFNGFGSMVSSILFYGVGQTTGFPVWKAIYLLCGSVTVVWAVVLFIFLPTSMLTTKRLKPEEKAVLIHIGRSNQTGIYNTKIKFSHIREAMCDAQVWILFVFVFLNELVNGGVANFGGLILLNIADNDPLKTTALAIVSGFMQVVFVFSGPYLASKFRNIRTIVMAAYILPSMTAIVVLWQLNSTDPSNHQGPLLTAIYLVSGARSSLRP